MSTINDCFGSPSSLEVQVILMAFYTLVYLLYYYHTMVAYATMINPATKRLLKTFAFLLLFNLCALLIIFLVQMLVVSDGDEDGTNGNDRTEQLLMQLR